MLILSKNLANQVPPELLLTALGILSLIAAAILLLLIIRQSSRHICFKCRKQIGETKWCKDCAEWRFNDARRRGAFESFEGDPE